MTKTYRLTSITAALFGFSLALAGHAAQAAPGISVGASISKPAFTVIDLTPNDDYSAAYTLMPNFSMARSDIITPAISVGKELNAKHGEFEPITATTTHGTSTSASSADQAGELSSRIEVLDAGTKAYGYVLQSIEVQIAAHTQLVFTGYSTLSISDPRQHGALNFAGEVSTFLSFSEQPAILGFLMRQRLGESGDRGVRTDPFSLTVDNNSDQDMSTTLVMTVLASAVYQAPSPVPEPATYAMFGLGALMVGAMARRQRRRAQA
ncbi:PEP-CTERM sorting domain-containing protein [Massilia sp. DJPM01]|uniref:PEP-CTERM sorting domain-containing protein n=1 Tax=Massilia sp. DJPM01 TaxID=3024404 RepID=UPI00259D5B65|nr:PEP-CTERM sorting domain-containing protein [Massilia sp. DJPM01]MDM5177721.1 PEP-CTERM sorting domain-containing protein [Massilia sp. DJPM01]